MSKNSRINKTDPELALEAKSRAEARKTVIDSATADPSTLPEGYEQSEQAKELLTKALKDA